MVAAATEAAQRGARAKTPRGDVAVARRFATDLAQNGSLTPEIESGVRQAGQRVVTRAFTDGWLPADLQRVADRRTDEFATAFLIDVIAAYAQPYPADAVDETWREQLAALGAHVWWNEQSPHLAQWAARHLLTPVEAITAVVAALALLLLLPKLELIRPLPGAALPAAAHRHLDAKVLGRVRGLLAKAESTSYPEEAETLSAKAQELMTKYALDRALLGAAAREPDLPGAQRLWLDTPYLDAKALLIDVVAAANRCRAIFAAQWGFVTVVGEPADLDAVELLSTSLLVQATRAMIASGNAELRSEDARTRDYRKAFLVAYATRIGERLETAAATVADTVDRERLLPVLASRQLAVDAAFENLFPRSRNRGITIRSADGWDAGRSAADRAHLHGPEN
ncbi:DUF2786 domain-containing protein [Nocardia stercoris]|uniref:DUF2786 domain-containing protein n=1 Tax=Nocardia stercoris TaxID=2483361 RepID=A0A3M2KYM9_9NOCA|nr:DUF2786 domain-containing protein [Nocardia stercoris]